MYTDSEIDAFRSPAAYVEWFDSLLIRIREERSQKNNALTHVGPFKVIYEELFPLARLLRLKATTWSGSEFKNVIGNQSYDVEVRNHSLKYFEIVSTIYDDAERFRMLKFINEKSVDALGRIVRDEAGRPVGICNEGDMRLHSDLIDERLLLVEEAIKKKATKAYPKPIGLIVYFDDSSIEISREDLAQFAALIDAMKGNWQPVFQNVFLIGPKGEICIEQ